jgi:hypothetical protein
MQAYGFNNAELINTERIIFKFLWSTNENPNGIDRIKRTIMKNDYSKGGMKVTDVESLDRSLKLKQFIRAHNSNHVISKIQAFLSTKSGHEFHMHQEYPKVTEEESVCKSAQETLNIIIDYNRETYKNILPEEYESDKNLIDEVSSINLTTFLKRKNKVFMLCVIKPLTQNGITTLGELIQAYEYETDEKLTKTMKIIISTFPETLVNISKCYNEGINSDNENMNYMLIAPNTRKNVNCVTVKELQVTLKNALKKIEVLDVRNKLGIDNFDEDNIIRFRSNCKNSKLRNIYFRLIHNDFFTHVRMKKYKMTQTDKCPRCSQTETSKHLLWECKHVQNIWSLFNTLMNQTSNSKESVNNYEDIFQPCELPSINMIKIKIIQELIQIERPVNWNQEKLMNVVRELINIERYNANLSRSTIKFYLKWHNFDNL